jgi:glycosyltransferase involved in cell wall biosynthesis
MEVLRNVIDKYPEKKSQIRVINLEENKGVANARLTGIKAATGEYLWFVDSDDWVESDSIEKCHEALQEEPDFILFDYYEESEETRYCKVEELTVSSLLVNRISPSLWKYIIKKSVLISNNIFPLCGADFAEDFLMTSCMALVSGKHIMIHEGLYHYNCQNTASYMNNITLTSLEDASKSVVRAYDFYKSNHAAKTYRIALAYMLCKRYLALWQKDKDNPSLSDLEERIRDTETLLGLCVTRLPMMSDFAMRVYRHFA